MSPGYSEQPTQNRRCHSMPDAREIRAHPERMRAAIRLRKVNPDRADLDRWLALDERRRQIQGAIDETNAEKNQLAKVGRSDPAAARVRGQELRQRTKEL